MQQNSWLINIPIFVAWLVARPATTFQRSLFWGNISAPNHSGFFYEHVHYKSNFTYLLYCKHVQRKFKQQVVLQMSVQHVTHSDQSEMTVWRDANETQPTLHDGTTGNKQWMTTDRSQSTSCADHASHNLGKVHLYQVSHAHLTPPPASSSVITQWNHLTVFAVVHILTHWNNN